MVRGGVGTPIDGGLRSPRHGCVTDFSRKDLQRVSSLRLQASLVRGKLYRKMNSYDISNDVDFVMRLADPFFMASSRLRNLR